MTTRPVHRDAGALGLVLLGGAAGTAARYGVERGWPTAAGEWPWATSTVNIVGAVVLGMLLQALIGAGPDTGVRRRIRLLVGSGFCGAFTTYSTLALETVTSVRADAPVLAALYVLISLSVGVCAAFVGIVLGHRLSRRGQWT